MASLTFPWIAAQLAVPAAVAAAGWLPIEAERYRRIALGAACLLVALGCLMCLAAMPAAGQDMADPLDPSGWILGEPLFRVDPFSSVLPPFGALLWVLAVGVTPRKALDRDGIRRTALATLITIAIFFTESPELIVALCALSVLVLLRALAAGGFQRARRVAGIYLGLSTLLLASGVLLARVAGGAGGLPWPAGLAVVLAVMIRKGIVPLHGWLPECFEHGRVGPVVLFCAPQIGAYVMVVLVVPGADPALLRLTGIIALVTSVYGALAAMAQKDARRAFGYLFMSQSALVFTGLECVSVGGLTGGLLLWLSSGVAFAALARCLVVLEARRGRLSLDRLNGGYERMPMLASSFLLTALASIGFPGTLGFIGHELLVDGTIAQYPRTGFLAVMATALGGIALVRIYFSLFCGRISTGAHLGLRPREAAIFMAFSGILLLSGLAPRLIVDSRESAAASILSGREPAAVHASASPGPAGTRDPGGGGAIPGDRNLPVSH